MSDDMRDGARQFWRNHRDKYPAYSCDITARRDIEVQTLLPIIANAWAIIDIGCGDGSLAEALADRTAAAVAGCDMASDYGFEFDIYRDNPEELCNYDFAILAGVVPFIFEDAIAKEFFARLPCPRIYVRAPCSTTGHPQTVAKFSEDLGENYYSLYRTLPGLMALVLDSYDIVGSGRSYPDELESKFPTRQYYLECARK